MVNGGFVVPAIVVEILRSHWRTVFWLRKRPKEATASLKTVAGARKIETESAVPRRYFL
jgi:hypothetical protein